MAWTTFNEAANTPTLRGYLNRPPCSTGTATPFPTLLVGNSITLANGVTGNGANNPVSLLQCWFAQGFDDRKFVVPVVDTGTACTSIPTSAPVVGFVGVELLSVTNAGASSSAGFQVLWRPDLAQPWDACP